MSPKRILRSQNQTELGCLIIPSPSLEEFSCLHPPVEGFQEKTISTPNPWDFHETTSPVSKTFKQSIAQPKRIPSHHVYLEMARKGWNHCQEANKIDATDSKETKIHTCICHACQNQLGNHTCNLLPASIPGEASWSNLSLLPLPSLSFPCFPRPSFACLISFSSWCSSRLWD